MRWVVLVLLIVPLAGAVTFDRATPWLSEGAVYTPETVHLRDYPDFLFSLAPPRADFIAKIVKGGERDAFEMSASNYLLNRLPQDFVLRYEDRYGRFAAARVNPKSITDNVILDSEVTGEEPVLVVVGTPCHNSLIPEILNKPCETAVKINEGLVRLVYRDGVIYLVITAGNSQLLFDTVKAFHTMRKSKIRKDFLRFVYSAGERVRIGNRYDMLEIGETLGSVTPALRGPTLQDPRYYYYTYRSPYRPRYRQYIGYRTAPRPGYGYSGYFQGQRVVG